MEIYELGHNIDYWWFYLDSQRTPCQCLRLTQSFPTITPGTTSATPAFTKFSLKKTNLSSKFWFCSELVLVVIGCTYLAGLDPFTSKCLPDLNIIKFISSCSPNSKMLGNTGLTSYWLLNYQLEFYERGTLRKVARHAYLILYTRLGTKPITYSCRSNHL